MSLLPRFDAPYAEADEAIATRLLAGAALPAAAEARIDARARALIGAIRAKSGGLGGIEDFLREYSLTTKEGLALMVLAEALLRVPDSRTADALIEDKLSGTDWAHRATRSEAWLVSASAWALGVTARVIHPGESPEGILETLGKRLGLPTVRAATRQAMRLLGSHFVLGQTIEEALGRAGAARRFRYSYDMLGEGARTAADAERYLASYLAAIAAIGRTAGNEALPNRPGISVKLSALHPRYEAVSGARVMRELVPKLLGLAQAAKAHDLNFTIDAEEADRLELSLDVIAAVLADPSLVGWDGFGLAVQAYQKRALAVIDWLDDLATRLDRRLMVRLVKGAYWDTEVKRAQERGLADFPVFTRKPMTDLHYMACARRLLAARPRIYPQFATHNALTIATILEEAGGAEGYEFQRLHGMGEALYEQLLATLPEAACRTYAPVGGHRDLLAYLVRRLLENGANSSFVSASADPAVPVETLLTRPQSWIGAAADARPVKLPRPRDLYAPGRVNSAGVEFGDERALAAFREAVAKGPATFPEAARPLVGGKALRGAIRSVTSPVDGAPVGAVEEADAAAVTAAFDRAAAGFATWSRTPVSTRAEALEKLADLMEARLGMVCALLAREAGKTLDDGVAEVREAVDFCRYYAQEARRHFGEGVVMPGPTGEENRLRLRGRGTIVCISPWNFPLAIFLGQVAAALAAGNAVIAKPAEQTPLVAAAAVALAHEAGIPADALALIPGDGRVGALLVGEPRVAGVAFTGSTEVAWIINRQLAAKRGPIVPLIAETGGINAMIVDATALPEQVSDDVVMSAFRSAGQRCSALRLLCLQEDVAEKMLEMVIGAAAELRIGDPMDPATHVGPVIDAEAKARLEAVVERAKAEGRLVWQARLPADLPPGLFVPPAVIRVATPEELTEEVFGPVLHVTTWKAGGLAKLTDAIAANGTGLTLGLHSRIDQVVEEVVARLANGNVYVNRNMIGAVVGTQPFGGSGLSGTGPKAGGPHYLPRFALEQVVTVNTAAAGGNASLLAGGEG
ncbi:bifunctional proline dehydrogenase/L-glutamate gamma-semialdehyde dehydrogenase PutA [Phreatobacter sp.]|uniref:bifunctional proline dehydrogenase/L-glutamate gamma-semialdehyde dehydrogenase PutA n=1 Tax=Phreatobacter sp. TaxID=1966341 RepID=UPI0022C26778|nr:bifunctional proline dehydrogenase/L-glutamate gamma-semialdehyde dehydrogenase PutA [Phreatobacter sp.]MCZ8317012.1 bifunctional proline dehydrogenase/L-glutamate gamma-semialdehyde dehydrogenase PutA [Phreatobacter sp.]